MSVCTLASIHEPLSQGRERRRVQMKTRRLVARGKRRGIRARRVRVAKERLHARRFFVRQIHEGPHWGSRQSTQYQSSPGTDRNPSHLTWHVFLHVPARMHLERRRRRARGWAYLATTTTTRRKASNTHRFHSQLTLSRRCASVKHTSLEPAGCTCIASHAASTDAIYLLMRVKFEAPHRLIALLVSSSLLPQPSEAPPCTCLPS